MPTFDEPQLTRPAAEVLECLQVGVPTCAAPLPPLTEPDDMAVVVDPILEPLVPVEHPKVCVLEVYRLAGWTHARPGTLLRPDTLERLGHAAATLPDRWSICVLDAWRSLELQAELYHAAKDDPDLPDGYLSYPDPDPSTPPPHVTGGTVDCTLSIDGIPLALGTGFDDFSERAHTAALETCPGVERDLRRVLFWAMSNAGFVVLDCEWWHFEFGTRRWATLTGHAPRYGPIRP